MMSFGNVAVPAPVLQREIDLQREEWDNETDTFPAVGFELWPRWKTPAYQGSEDMLREQQCPTCFATRAVNGTCFCD